MNRDGTGVPSIRQSKAKKARQKADDCLCFVWCDLPSAGFDDYFIECSRPGIALSEVNDYTGDPGTTTEQKMSASNRK